MSASVRLLLLRRVHAVLDHAVKRIAKHLSEHDVHPHSGADNNLANASLNASAAQGQMQLSVELSSVNQKIGAPNGGVAFVNDAPFYIAYMQGLAAAKNYALNSHIRPHDLTASEIMNAHMAGVEP